jgi:hypothetical protein
MNRLPFVFGAAPQENRMPDEPTEIRLLFHRLNNQLGIVLAHAELMEAKAASEIDRARASQVVTGMLEALGTTKEIRLYLGNGH